MEALGLLKYMDSQTSVNPSNHKYNLLSKWDAGPPNVMFVGLYCLYSSLILELFGYWSKPWHLVNPKIAGKWMFIPLELIIIGFDPPPFH